MTLIAAFLFFTTQISAHLSFQMPNHFWVTERWFSWSSTFDVETDDRSLGTVYRRILTLAPLQYDFYDPYGTLQAKGRMRWLSFGATFDVYDAFDNNIGMVDEHIFTFFPTFDIISPEGHLLATAKMNFWGTKYVLRDPVTYEEIALLSRPFLRLRSSWSIDIINPQLFERRQIHPTLFILVLAFQTDREHWEAEAAASRNEENNVLIVMEKTDHSKPKLTGSHEVRVLKAQLKPYSKEVVGIQPTEHDFAKIDELSQQYLAAHESDTPFETSKDRIVCGVKIMLKMLEEVTLQPGEKSALVALINDQISMVENLMQ